MLNIKSYAQWDYYSRVKVKTSLGMKYLRNLSNHRLPLKELLQQEEKWILKKKMWDVKFNRFSYSMCNFLYFSFFWIPRIIWCLTSSVWLTSLSMPIFRYTHIAVNVIILFFLWLSNIPLLNGWRSWISIVFVIWWEQLIYWKSSWCWEKLRAEEEEGIRG